LREIGLAEFERDAEVVSINTLDDAASNELSFFDNPKYLDSITTTKAAAVFIKEEFSARVPSGVHAIVTDEPYLMMAYASKLFAEPLIGEDFIEPVIGDGSSVQAGVHLGSGCRIGANVTILSGSFIGENVTVGDDTIIHPNVTLYNHTTVGCRCIINAGSVIGCDGYGFAHTKMGEHVKIYHNGRAIIEDDVEIGANCSIDRAVFGKTIIKKGSKIDNLVHIAHNCEVGEYALLTGQVGLSGSTKLGRNVVMGGQSGTAGHLEIGDFATIAARGGVTKSIKGGETYAGFPIMLHKKWLKMQAKLLQSLK
jgi:UDP-3-O-[3-hydroxymyristoyl] glucosamine N-acyltransferase